MAPHLRLKKVVGPALSTNRKDVLSVKTVLSRLGLFEDREHGITPFAEPRMFESIKRFQRAQGLAVDGVMRRRGPTLEALNKAMVRNDVMRDIRPRGGPPSRAIAGGIGLKGALMSNAAADPDDVVKMKTALAYLGLFDDPEFGITGLPDSGLFEGIRKFQITRHLEPDGVVTRQGPTLKALNAELREQDGAPARQPRPSGLPGPGGEGKPDEQPRNSSPQRDFAKELEDLGHDEDAVDDLAKLAGSDKPKDKRVVRLLRAGLTPQSAREIAKLGERETADTLELAEESKSRSKLQRMPRGFFTGIASKVPLETLPDSIDPFGTR